ncbi:uncharacterized protein ALTATR162_LOCUS11811 [Alternaria atra]|uniref:Caffeine resistance protein 5 n=1 Tax=Alternaria atra TaxID=119953 RepID=A0A8J2NBT4_9PLEO|nr:uncharacterized protein ALTATR162_LOCUS11811 [Alternaria atra]CAG5187872.1 unnamed protein product [Alternaria atra]
METLKEIVRDAPFGQLVRYATRNRIFKYPEELPGFQIPAAYTEKSTGTSTSLNQSHANNSATAIRQPSPDDDVTSSLPADLEKLPSRTAELEKPQTHNSTSTTHDADAEIGLPATTLPSHTLPFSVERLEAERLEATLALHGTRSASQAIAPTKTADGLILAEWYTTTDSANPQNWSRGKKAWSAFLICLYTFIVSQWELLWMAAPVFLLFFFFLPETQPTTILLHRSARLRALTGNANIRTQTEIDRKGTKFSATLFDAIIKPLEICVKDPALLFINVYSALTYGIYYSFFEVFPLVYLEIYGFSVGEMAIVFLSIIVGCLISITIYFSYLRFYLIPDILKRGLRPQEHRLVPAIFASFGVPIGLFLFGWTARHSVHWIASAIGITIYSTTVFIIFQAVFSYVPMSYPQYAASLFAGNDFCRSAFAFGSVLFSRPMYLKLGVGKGVSLLGGLSVMGIIGMYLIWVYGARLRARSKFAV